MAVLYQVNVVSVKGTRTKWIVHEDWTARAHGETGEGGESLIPSNAFVFWMLLDLLAGMRDGGEEYMGGAMYCPLEPDDAEERATESDLLPILDSTEALDLDQRLRFLRDKAKKYIASVEIGERKHHNAFPYLHCDPVPQAEYLIEATDPRWLNFLVPGTRLETASYPPEL